MPPTAPRLGFPDRLKWLKLKRPNTPRVWLAARVDSCVEAVLVVGTRSGSHEIVSQPNVLLRVHARSRGGESRRACSGPRGKSIHRNQVLVREPPVIPAEAVPAETTPIGPQNDVPPAPSIDRWSGRR